MYIVPGTGTRYIVEPRIRNQENCFDPDLDLDITLKENIENEVVNISQIVDLT
jgi:hypothetical protein